MQVEVGQIWADADKRAAGRKIRVEALSGEYADCVVIAERGDPERLRGRYNRVRPQEWSAVGFRTRILLRRFKPTSTGYRLLSEPEQPTPNPSIARPHES